MATTQNSQQPTNCLSVFEHFLELAFKGYLLIKTIILIHWFNTLY